MPQKPSEHPEIQSLIFPYQRNAYDRLCSITKAFIGTDFSGLSIKPRGNVFLIGPSGSGKTHLAQAVANGLSLNYLPIAVSEWIVMGASQRSAPSTWPTIYQFIQELANKPGGIIYLDELDKIGDLKGNGDWVRYQATEVFFLLDRKFPRNLNDLEGDRINDEQISNAEATLRDKTIILAGGAFQNIWDAVGTIGFNIVPEAPVPVPDLNQLARFIPAELIRRFGSQLVILPRLQESDYHDILARILPTLPAHWRSHYNQLAVAGIPEATRLAQGPRYFEELLLEVAIRQPMSAQLEPAHAPVGPEMTP